MVNYPMYEDGHTVWNITTTHYEPVNKPRRVSRKPGYVRGRAKRKNATDFYKLNAGRFEMIEDYF